MELIKTHSGNYGLKLSLEAMMIAKSSYYYLLEASRKQANQELKEHLNEAITDHPDYGRRGLLPEVIERSSQTVNYKRLRRLLAGIWE